jgi:glutamate/tyrosine decarboxylase-like PLP-dependent enzyme
VPELSRRARGVPVWALLKTYGRDGIAAMVERHCSLARRFAKLLAAEPGIRVLNDVVLNQLIVNFGSDDAAQRKTQTEAVIARVQQDGVCYAGGAQWRDDWVLRLSVISAPTTEADIDMSAAAIISAWRDVQKG